MRIELLYIEDCPSQLIAAARLTEALRATGESHVAVERHLVTTPEQAGEMAFIGSPTIRINGTDPFAVGDEQVGMACRIFDTPSGPEGSPTTAQLLRVLS